MPPKINATELCIHAFYNYLAMNVACGVACSFPTINFGSGDFTKILRFSWQNTVKNVNETRLKYLREDKIR